MAIAIALPGFNDLGRSVTPFFPFEGSLFLPIFYVKRKNEEKLSIRSLNFFAKCTNEFRSFSVASSLSVRRFKCILKGSVL